MIEITMPRLSDTMEEGTIATWHKHPGDHVRAGDILVEIETDKAVMEYEAYENGVLSEILVTEGQTVPIGAPIALLDATGAGHQATASAPVAAAAPAPTPPPSPAPGPAPHSAPSAPTLEPTVAADRLVASPLVRRLAREHQLDLRDVRGTGPGGRIVRRDLTEMLEHRSQIHEAFTELRGPAVVVTDEKRGSEAVPVTSTRRVIARRMSESARTVPHFYATAMADAGPLVRMRRELNGQLAAVSRPKVSVNDLVVKACALALRQHPGVNSSYVDDTSTTMLVHRRINIGVAVASAHGLVVPVITDADQRTVTDIGAETHRLMARAEERRLTVEDMSGGTFTISNLGMFGVEQFTAIINPPEAAILAVGATTTEPVVVDGTVEAGYRLRYTLSSDHRVIDGALAAQFLRTLTTYLENPWTLVA
ncbi:MAG: dihydrolipoamide acetyltransferase family protein [Acidimicrobiales bacterium]